MNNNEKDIISEEEITLAPEKELKVIKNNAGTKKYPMILEYSKTENKQDALQLLSELKCPIVETIDFAKCIVADLTKSEIEKIRKCDFIETVERNYKYDLLGIDNNQKNDSHNITHRSIEVLKGCEKPRNKVKVAIFDTGIDKHPDLTIAGGVSFVGKAKAFTDTNGHGTKIAGIIASVENKEADTKFIDLYAVKVFDESEHATTTSIIRAINWSIENKINIINMSFGVYYPSKLLKKYIDMAIDEGIIIVAAVGNDGGFKNKHRIMYPAKYDGVVAVGAGNANGISKFSNNSIDLDFVAPGTAISTDVNGGYANITGTSVSCAYITSMLASLWSANNDTTSVELINAAKNSGIVQNANTSYVGYGEINAEIALTNIGSHDNIEIDKSSVYSADMLSSVSDTSYNILSRTVTSSSYSCSGSNDCDCGCDCGINWDDVVNSAISLNLNELTEISYSQLEQGVWYKFIANSTNAHPGLDIGFYHIYTHGSSDTIGKLYNSTGTLVAYNEGDTTVSWRGFEIYAQLEFSKTYYIYVKEKNLAGGSVSIGVMPVSDDYSNTLSTASYLENVYEENLTATGFIHNAIDQYQHGDLDYFRFISTKDCVVEIYSEGSSEVYCALFDANGVSITLDSYETVNDDFKLTCKIESGKEYYIEISKLSDFDYATDYTFNVKFIRCYNNGEYCGGDNFMDITEHTMQLTDNGYLVCTKCGYKIQSPTLQDKEILSEEDYYTVLSCYIAIPYYATLERSQETTLYIPPEVLLAEIDKIRSKSEYAYKYDFIDTEGNYVCTHHADVEYNYTIHSSYHDINNQIDLISHNGVLEDSISFISGLIIPSGHGDLFSAITRDDTGIGNMIYILGYLAESAGYGAISILLDLILMGASADETIELTDRVVYISLKRLDISYEMKSKFVFTNEGKLKAQHHSYTHLKVI